VIQPTAEQEQVFADLRAAHAGLMQARRRAAFEFRPQLADFYARQVEQFERHIAELNTRQLTLAKRRAKMNLEQVLAATRVQEKQRALVELEQATYDWTRGWREGNPETVNITRLYVEAYRDRGATVAEANAARKAGSDRGASRGQTMAERIADLQASAGTGVRWLLGCDWLNQPYGYHAFRIVNACTVERDETQPHGICLRFEASWPNPAGVDEHGAIRFSPNTPSWFNVLAQLERADWLPHREVGDDAVKRSEPNP
jgi:hypothetical protein